MRAHRNDIAARAIGKGHILWRADYRAGSGQVIFCSRCGCYAEQRTRLLRDRCVGPKTARSRTFCTHWEAGRHPHNFRDVDVSARVRFCVGTLPADRGGGQCGGRNPTAVSASQRSTQGARGLRSQGEVRRTLLRCAFDDPDWDPGLEEEPPAEEGAANGLSPPSPGPFEEGPI